ncbi:MAG: hypothetical protein DMF56_21835 [Acidobacteria bacterium]|nr:MAG: hypothetical protein DMF56_21835 [Acidobacteriota bacterium]
MLRRPWPLYIGWIAVCAILFVALRNAEDPARPKGRILSIDAGARALTIARARGLRDYEVVHVARARAGEGGKGERWVVLMDRVPHTSLKNAVIIELRARDGELLAIRAADEGRRQKAEGRSKN